jgi:hypothetical protein
LTPAVLSIDDQLVSLKPLNIVRELAKIKAPLISSFIVFHILAIVCWSVPLNTLVFATIKNEISPYMFFSGLSQNWGMFSSPPNANVRVEAEILYRDGERRVWRFPLPQDLTYTQRYFRERYRKFANDNLRLDDKSALWPDAARYIARLNNDPNNSPVVVRLSREFSQIAPPGSSETAPPQHQLFFTYLIKPGDLE